MNDYNYIFIVNEEYLISNIFKGQRREKWVA
jgi:hypothetical protein